MKHRTKTEDFPEDFFSKCDQIRRKLWIWLHLLKKSLMENFIFCAVKKYYSLATKNFPVLSIYTIKTLIRPVLTKEDLKGNAFQSFLTCDNLADFL